MVNHNQYKKIVRKLHKKVISGTTYDANNQFFHYALRLQTLSLQPIGHDLYSVCTNTCRKMNFKYVFDLHGVLKSVARIFP